MTNLVVVPAYDEEACIADVVTSIRNHDYDCVVIDDASTDNTAEVAEKAGAVAVMVVELTTMNVVAGVPPKETAEPVEVKLVPVMVTDVPPSAGPEVGERPVTVGAGVT